MDDTQNTELMSIFDFTAEDLEANRSGQMTARQIDQVKFMLEDAQWHLGCFFVLFPACLLGGFICTTAQDPANQRPIRVGPSEILIIMVVLAMVVIAVVGVFNYFTKAHTDIEKRVIAVIDGKAGFYIQVTKWGRNYFIETGTHLFPTKPSVYTKFSDFLAHTGPEMQFRFYYAPKSDTLLAIEVLEPPT